MSRRKRRSVDIFNLSFRDVVSCGFGAIILLLVIVKVSEPGVIEGLATDLTGIVNELSQKLPSTIADGEKVSDELEDRRNDLAAARRRLASLEKDLAALRGQYQTSRTEQEAQAVIEGQLERAAQGLSDDMKRLLGSGYVRKASDSTIGGVPVDSEYIIFIIDTSGSMNQNAWALVVKKTQEVLDIYPTVKGIQVMNDMGDYMFSQYRGRWIPDSPARRRAILQRLAGWAPFSNSSPVEGIDAAIRRFYATDKRISLYIFGDDFARGSIQAVLDTVEGRNRADASGRRRVRIHAVGFPVLFAFANNGMPASVVRFAALMRKLAEDNGGSFVGLNSTRP
ncbi:MAG: VWA domain-containing protein [Myxococcales bacterium]|nr:MAG: VWA domain-containing protein [Myxococcales bacterium]